MNYGAFLAAAFVAMAPVAAAAQTSPAPIATPPLASGRSLSAPGEITAGDALARALLLAENLELIRRFMGRITAPRPLFRAQNPTMAEVYFTALSTKVRIDQLSFELMRTARPGRPEFPKTEVTVADVLAKIDESLQVALRVKRSLGITVEPPETVQSDNSSLGDLYNLLLSIASSINGLVDARARSGDSFSVTTILVHQAMALHLQLTTRMMPDEPAVVPNKTPEDVFQALMASFALISRLLEAEGMPVLAITRDTEGGRTATNSDIIDLTVLMVAELDRLLRARGRPGQLPPVAYLRRKYPSDVVARVKLLQAILEDIVAAKAAGAKRPAKPESGK